VLHDDINVLCLGARIIGPATAQEAVKSFVRSKFSGGARHVRRVAKTAAVEKENFK